MFRGDSEIPEGLFSVDVTISVKWTGRCKLTCEIDIRRAAPLKDGQENDLKILQP